MDSFITGNIDYSKTIDDWLQMYLQPIFGFNEKKFVKAESLARLVNPSTGEIIYPSCFLNNPTLSHIGLFKKGLSQVIKYFSIVDGVEISINLDVDLLPKVIDYIENLVSNKLLDPSRLIIELLENKNDFSLPFLELNRLKKIGIKIAMDDFGCGHSNVKRAADIDFDYIKIDKGMLAGLKTNKSKSFKLIKNIVNMNADLGCKTIIEGVETFTELEFARLSGADYAQGYCVAKPMSFNDFLSWM